MKTKDITRNMLKKGMIVEIFVRSGRSEELRVEGPIDSILTRSESHPHGILVRLDSGEKGRVQSILDSTEEVNPSSASIRSGGGSEETSLETILQSGENHNLEYKESLFWSQDLSKDDLESNGPETKKYGRGASKVIVSKVIAAFLNSDGGTLVIGLRESTVGEANTIVGIQGDYSKLKDKSADGFRRAILDQVIRPYFPDFVFQRFADYLEIAIESLEGQDLCVLNVRKADSRVFLKVGNESLFMIRVDASNRQLKDEEILNYCDRRFG